MEETELADMAAWRDKDDLVKHFGDSGVMRGNAG